MIGDKIMRNFLKPARNGFTVLELLISLFIIAVSATIFVAGFSNFRESGNLGETHANVIGILRDARIRTISSKNNLTYGVHFETTKVVLFRGTAYNSGEPTNETYLLPNIVSISSISLTGGATETVFTRLQGTTTASGTITLSTPGGQTRTITILSAGIVE